MLRWIATDSRPSYLMNDGGLLYRVTPWANPQHPLAGVRPIFHLVPLHRDGDPTLPSEDDPSPYFQPGSCHRLFEAIRLYKDR